MDEEIESDPFDKRSQSEVYKIQQRLLALEVRIRLALKAGDSFQVSEVFSKEVEKLKNFMTKLRFESVSQRLDLEALLANIDRLLSPNAGEILLEEETLQKNAIETLYTYAYHLYRSSKFSDALYLFSLLTQLSSEEYRFYFSIAACLHQQKAYQEAMKFYLLSSKLEPENPIPFFHLADCQKELKLYQEEKKSLLQVVQIGSGNLKYSYYVEKAELILKGLGKNDTDADQ